MTGPSLSLHLTTTVGQPVRVGDVTVTPYGRALVVRLPFGGFVWHAPAAVLVERDGRRDRVPIVDVTRAIQIGLIGLAVLGAIIAARTARR